MQPADHDFRGVPSDAAWRRDDPFTHANGEIALGGDKPVAIVGVSGGSWGTRLAQTALRQMLPATEARVTPAPIWIGPRMI